MASVDARDTVSFPLEPEVLHFALETAGLLDVASCSLHRHRPPGRWVAFDVGGIAESLRLDARPVAISCAVAAKVLQRITFVFDPLRTDSSGCAYRRNAAAVCVAAG